MGGVCKDVPSPICVGMDAFMRCACWCRIDLPRFCGHQRAGETSRQEVSHGTGKTLYQRVQGECRAAVDESRQDGRRGRTCLGIAAHTLYEW